ncbi:MAG: peptide MFS transporter [Bacteroidetes bacterium]|nr:peptide MFS transporter [Bacteroidota bacterium]
MSNSSTGHPKGLYLLFITEMFERFSYYGMRAIFILFLTKALLFDKVLSSDIYGSYTGLVYLTPLLGGYMADRYWGNRKSIIIGGIMMAIGQFCMFLSGSFYTQIEFATLLMVGGLGMLIFGNGFFKPNISTMVGQLYVKGDKRIDSAFTIFYMGINLGAFLSPLICGGLGNTGDPADFKWGFLAASIGMMVSTLIFIWLKSHYLVSPEGRAIGDKPNVSRDIDVSTSVEEVKSDFTKKQVFTWLGIEVGLFSLFYLLGQGVIGSFIFSLSIAAPGFIISDKSLTKHEKERIWVIYIVAFFVIFFWAAFEQAGASLTFFADEQTNREVGIMLSKSTLTIIYSVIIFLLGFLGFKVFTKMMNEQKGVRELILVLIASAIGALVYLISGISPEGMNIQSIPASAFQSVNAIAIVIFAPIFSILWTALGNKGIEPASPYKQSIGLLLLAFGYAVIAIGVKGIEPSAKVNMMWLLSLYLIHTFGNKFAGTLSSYYPETMLSVVAVQNEQTLKNIIVCEKMDKKETINGADFVSIDLINLESIKDKTVKAEVVKNIFANSVIKEKSFVGYKINSLYSFFMLFVFMAGIASVILFFLSKKLLSMMHGIS